MKDHRSFFHDLSRCEISFIIYDYITNLQRDKLLVGLIAQLVEHCTGITEVMSLNPIQAWI